MESHAHSASASADATADGARDPEGEHRRRRLLFRATHRGTHETDLLVGGFVAAGFAGFDDDELDALEEVMELPDVDLADWLTGRRPVPPTHDSPMLRRMVEAAQGRAAERQRP